MKKKLIFSTCTTGNGELARSNRNFNNKVKSQQFLTKEEKAMIALYALFKCWGYLIINYNKP